MLLAALMLFAQDGGPPASMSVCYDGQCQTEASPRTPIIVFFPKGEAGLSSADLDFVDEFARQRQWWPHLTVWICSAPEGATARDASLQERRVTLLRSRLRSHGWQQIVSAIHGKRCDIGGGPDRTAGRNAISLDLRTVDD